MRAHQSRYLIAIYLQQCMQRPCTHKNEAPFVQVENTALKELLSCTVVMSFGCNVMVYGWTCVSGPLLRMAYPSSIILFFSVSAVQTNAVPQDSEDDMKHTVSLGSWHHVCISHLSHARYPEGRPFLFPRCCICCIYRSCYILSAIQPKLAMS